MQEVVGTPGVIAFASQRFSSTDSRRAPTPREFVRVSCSVDHSKIYLAEREFRLVFNDALSTLRDSEERPPLPGVM